MNPTTSILLWAGLLIALAMIGGFVIMVFRRRALGRNEKPSDVGLIEQLRGMVERGEMTAEEFDRARRKIVERAAASAERDGDDGVRQP
ncbi:MAG: SHOCT domain-containing protein [Planctomycetota bacterium]